MRKATVSLAAVIISGLLLACSPASPPPALPPSVPLPATTTTPQATENGRLTSNPVESSKPIYGGTLQRGYWIPASFDAHKKVAYGPTATLPVFNQLVIFDINYKETLPEAIIGDLAESWETSQDGTEITFHLHQGVKWHDGVPFTADDVLYTLDKMTDVNRSGISAWFPAYDHAEKLDDYTVKVHLKYASAGFMIALAQGESQIQALHLAGTDDQSAAFMVGTGPFILTDYLPQIHLKFKRNSDYFKKDKYGNQQPYLDSMVYYHLPFASAREMVVGRRLDILDAATGAANLDTYTFLKDGAPELLWQRRDRYNSSDIIFNLSHKPLDDIRVRRALALVLNQEDLIIGYSGDAMFGIPDTGILHPVFGLPKDEIIKLMGWDKPYDERVAQARQLMAEAGYPDGFKLNMMSAVAGNRSSTGATMVYAEALRTKLKIDVTLTVGIGTIELQKRLADGSFDTYTQPLDIFEPLQLADYFKTGGYGNFSGYSNPEVDRLLGELDHIINLDERREAIRTIERILLTDLPALPTGTFAPNFMPYYPQVKNVRWNYMLYSNISRFEDVWLDESLRVK